MQCYVLTVEKKNCNQLLKRWNVYNMSMFILVVLGFFFLLVVYIFSVHQTWFLKDLKGVKKRNGDVFPRVIWKFHWTSFNIWKVYLIFQICYFYIPKDCLFQVWNPSMKLFKKIIFREKSLFLKSDVWDL